MVNYLREIVSGKKARFIDHESATNLDLVYVTDRVLIMGWPATGVASVYRNKRRDVLRFINDRHGEKWWIWNLCPMYENAYSAESMSGRVSRYPFPDHHAPPLALLPLAVREMRAWLDGDSERVAIIHCKAGKGRSGTLLCSYILSLPELPPPPMLDRSYSQRAPRDLSSGQMASGDSNATRDGWIIVGSGDVVAEVPTGDDELTTETTPESSEQLTVSRSTPASLSTLSRTSSASGSIEVTSTPEYEPIAIGDETAPGSAGQQDRADGTVDAVFKLHSSRRMKPTSTGRGVSIASQRRWVRYMHLLFTNNAPPSYLAPHNSRVRLVSVTMFLTPPTGWKKPLTSVLVGSDSGRGKAWASVARYDDAYVDELARRGGSGEGLAGDITWGGVAGDGRYDSRKMFKSCGKMVANQMPTEFAQDKRIVHHLTPETANGESLILDRSREMRIKFHLGSLPLGWAWLIPAFHLQEPIPPTNRTHTLKFPRSQIDFPLGPGQAVEEIFIQLEEMSSREPGQPARLLSDHEEQQEGLDDQRGEGKRLDRVEE